MILKNIFTSLGAVGLDLIFLAVNALSFSFNQLGKWIYTGIKMTVSIIGLIFSSIILCQKIYGLNWIKKNKDGTMNNKLRHKMVSEEVKRIPKIYLGWMTIMTIV